MAETTMAVGTVCWIELGTTDTAAAKRFYGDVFGWGSEDMPMGEGMTYTMFPSAQKATGGMYALMPDQKAMGVPPHWLTYFLVANVDERAAKVAALGGKVLREPMDVMGYGRMAVVQDPVGGVFALWQTKNPGNSGMPQGAGCFGWTQLNTHDLAKSKAFYGPLLGWTPKDDPMPDGSGTYTTWMAGEAMAGGMMALPPGEPAPSHWLVYFTVDDVDATAGKVAKAGGKTFVPPMDVPGMLRFAVFCDPQGAAFAVMKTFMPA